MTLQVKHSYQSSIGEGGGSGRPGGLIGPTEWNAAHSLTGVADVSQGGTGGGTASGTLLDNITGFSSTGFLKRTGSGTYAFETDVALLDVSDQTVSGGANITSNNLGTKSSGTLTIDCGTCPLQYVTNGGAFTLASPANDGSCMVLVTNNSSAGTITFSGFSVGTNTGDSLNTTNTDKFTIMIWCINGISGYRVAAHQ